MRPKTRLLYASIDSRWKKWGIGCNLEQLLVFCRAAMCPEMNGWGLFGLATTKSKDWRGAFRTAVHFALMSQQSAVRTVCLSMDTSSSSHSIFYNVFCQIIYNYKHRRSFHEQLSCLANVYLNISNLHSSLGVVNCQISAEFVVIVNIIYTLSKLVNSCRKSTRLE